MKFFTATLLAVSFLACPFSFAAQHAATATTLNSVEARIRRVESGLLPPVLVKDVPAWTIEERMKHYKIPGLSIAVINDFKVEWARAYGVKDVATGEPVTLRTLFQAGSISKPVAAAVALHKVEKGKLSLTENINNYLVSWKLPDNEFTSKKKVTLANLLSHTAGLTVHGFPGYAVGAPLPTLPQVLDGSAPANTAPVRVDMEPGTRFRYSGGGTTIAQLAVMDVEGRPFPEIASDTVLKPLGMSDSTYEQPLSPDWRQRAASGHRRDGQTVDGKIHIYPEMAAAGLWTTPTDLAKFGIETQLSLAGKSNKVLSTEMTARMVTPFIAEHVGLGFFLQNKGGSVYFGHGGADEGFRAGLLVHKEKGYGMAIMVNSDNGQIIEEVFRAVAGEYGWEGFLPKPHEVVKVAPEKLDAYVGRYLVNPDQVLKIMREGEYLFAEPTGSSKVKLWSTSETTFVRTDANVGYTIIPNAEGIVEKIMLRLSDDSKIEAIRISPEKMIPYELLVAGKVGEALEAYRKIKKERPDDDAVSERRLNGLGYELLHANKYTESIALFALNAELYPQSSNVYDSLGEAYMKSGNRESAVKNYRRSLELNQKNANAAQMLKKLEQK